MFHGFGAVSASGFRKCGTFHTLYNVPYLKHQDDTFNEPVSRFRHFFALIDLSRRPTPLNPITCPAGRDNKSICKLLITHSLSHFEVTFVPRPANFSSGHVPRFTHFL